MGLWGSRGFGRVGVSGWRKRGMRLGVDVYVDEVWALVLLNEMLMLVRIQESVYPGTSYGTRIGSSRHCACHPFIHVIVYSYAIV